MSPPEGVSGEAAQVGLQVGRQGISPEAREGARDTTLAGGRPAASTGSRRTTLRGWQETEGRGGWRAGKEDKRTATRAIKLGREEGAPTWHGWAPPRAAPQDGGGTGREHRTEPRQMAMQCCCVCMQGGGNLAKKSTAGNEKKREQQRAAPQGDGTEKYVWLWPRDGPRGLEQHGRRHRSEGRGREGSDPC